MSFALTLCEILAAYMDHMYGYALREILHHAIGRLC